MPAQVDSALKAIGSRVDEAALRSQVYDAKLERQLSALAASQETLQVVQLCSCSYFFARICLHFDQWLSRGASCRDHMHMYRA